MRREERRCLQEHFRRELDVDKFWKLVARIRWTEGRSKRRKIISKGMVLVLRFHADGSVWNDYAAIGRLLGCSREHARNLAAHALRIMLHPRFRSEIYRD